MKYFEKMAAGPVIVYKKPFRKDSAGFYISSSKAKHTKPERILEKHKATKKGLIVIDPEPFKGMKRAMRADFKDYTPKEFKEVFDWQTKHYVKNTRQHELTHYLRDKKGKWSFKYSNRFYPAKIIEETAAIGRAEGSKLKGFILALKNHPPLQALKKFIRR